MQRKITDFEGFSGHVIIDLGKYRERLNELASLNLNFNANGEIDFANANMYQQGIKFFNLVQSKVKEVDLTHIQSGTKFNSLDDLEDYAEYQGVMTRLVEIYNKGQSLGN